MTARKLATYAFFGLLPLLAALAPEARAWKEHRLIMESLGRTTANLNRQYLYKKIHVPNKFEEQAVIRELAGSLLLNEKKIPVWGQLHPDQGEVVLYELFRGTMIDEPDQGMDQDLPDAADPSDTRQWMGGYKGISSQGFRHMYYAGLQLKAPFATLQWPPRPMGYAKSRFQKLMKLSNHYFANGDKFWGTRLLLWALHYLQDLHQPFHVIQIPNWRYLPWGSLFNGFVEHSTHALTNYHYAYEEIASQFLEHYSESRFRECLETSKVELSEDLSEVVDKTREESEFVAGPLYDLVGPILKSREIDLQKGQSPIDFWQLLRSGEGDAAPTLRDVTCRLYQSMAQYVWGHFDRAFNYMPESSTKSGR